MLGALPKLGLGTISHGTIGFVAFVTTVKVVVASPALWYTFPIVALEMIRIATNPFVRFARSRFIFVSRTIEFTVTLP